MTTLLGTRYIVSGKNRCLQIILRTLQRILAYTNWGYKALGDHSRSQTLSLITFYRVEYKMKLKELCESRNSNSKNLRAEKTNEIRFDCTWNLKARKLFFFRVNLIFYENL